MRSTTFCPRIRSWSKRHAAVAIAAAALSCSAVVHAESPEAGERWVPSSTDTVLVTLPFSTKSDESLQSLRRLLQTSPDDAVSAARFARTALRRYAEHGDPRLLGYADGALKRWRDVPTPPPDIWLLRGRLLQTQHEFSQAASDLERLLEVHPNTVEAMLLAADARRRAGDIDDARGLCLRLQFAGRADLARLCAADLLLTLGQAADAHAAAAAALDTMDTAADDAQRTWALSLLADTARAAGRRDDARAAYEAALGLSQRPPLALSLAYIDFLIDGEELEAAQAPLDALPPADAVLLRRAIVARKSPAGVFPDAADELENRFEASDIAGTAELHWRERAVYALHVRGDAGDALRYARRNWQAQKGWEDAELLIDAADRAGDAAAARIVGDWRAGRQRRPSS